ncbi:hypothetical protein GH153_06165 [bacterium]|nr:hypothetical protein [bacterium]
MRTEEAGFLLSSGAESLAKISSLILRAHIMISTSISWQRMMRLHGLITQQVLGLWREMLDLTGG